MRHLLALFIAFAAFPALAEEALPVEAFFSHPKMVDAQLSPSGKWLAITAFAGTGRNSLAVVDSQGKQPPVVVATFSNADIRRFSWVNDDRLIFSVIDYGTEMMRQTFGAGLFSIKRDGTEQRQLIYARPTQFESVHAAGRQPLEWTNSLLMVPRGGGDTVIVGEAKFDLLDDLDSVVVRRLNVVDGSSTILSLGQPAHATRWIFNRLGEPRGVLAQKDGQMTLWWRAPGSEIWDALAKYPAMKAPFSPEFVDAQEQLYVDVPDGSDGTTVVQRFDFATKTPTGQAIVKTPGFDFDGDFITDDASGKVIGIRVDTDAEQTVWLDPHMKALQAIVDRKLPGRINRVSCGRCENADVVLVHSWSDRDPGSFWLYSPKADTWSSVGSVRPAIDPNAMATLDIHRIKARDGSDLPVWITTPKGKAPPGGWPAVALVHGGPFVRGVYWEWNRETQFLASRGYLVVEPEFRGSTGYGEAHARAGWKHWGDTMQDDVADAVDWASKQGLVDRSRVCIAGASYGGYSTLMSLVRYPDKYRCGVAWAAVTDPLLMFDASWQSDLPEEWRGFGLKTILGDPDKDAAMLHASAPWEHASQIRAPLLLAFGRDDRRVPLEHGTKMRDALRAAGHPPEWIVYEGEGHGWLKPENNFDFYQRVQAFLDKQLK